MNEIKGSRFFREYCKSCGEPIRVSQWKVGQNNICSSCEHPVPPAWKNLTPRQRHKLK